MRIKRKVRKNAERYIHIRKQIRSSYMLTYLIYLYWMSYVLTFRLQPTLRKNKSTKKSFEWFWRQDGPSLSDIKQHIIPNKNILRKTINMIFIYLLVSLIVLNQKQKKARSKGMNMKMDNLSKAINIAINIIMAYCLTSFIIEN